VWGANISKRFLSSLDEDEQRQLAVLLRRIADQQGLAPGVHPGYARLGGPGKAVCDVLGKGVR
jgi:hypothetical protein